MTVSNFTHRKNNKIVVLGLRDTLKLTRKLTNVKTENQMI